MITRAAIPVMLAALATAAGGGDLPLTFVRGGRTVEAAVAGQARSVRLVAFGREWTMPAPVIEGAAKIEVPAVRVPTVFAIVPAGKEKRPVGQVVAYPDRDAGWDGKIALYAAGPTWFGQWGEAIGIPLKRLAPKGLPRTLAGRPRKARELLVLGRSAAGSGLARVGELADRHAIDVLVLDADWFGPAAVLEDGVPAGRGMAGGLAEFAKQRWRRPLRFTHHRRPWAGLCNRRAWIQGPDWPLVEEILRPGARRRIVLSYLPWSQQLGRRDEADETLLAILAAAGSPLEPGARRRRLRVLHPPTGQLDRRRRPVLAVAHAAGVELPAEGEPARVLDLRGSRDAPDRLLDPLRSLGETLGPARPLIVLGDDPLLRQWKWLKLDRQKGKSKTKGVVWLPADALPPATNSQVRLMQALTECDVPVWDNKQEKSDEKDKD